MMEILLEILRQTGLAGVAVVAVWFAVRKDRQVTAVYDRMEYKSDRFMKKFYKLSTELGILANELLAILDEQNKSKSKPKQPVTPDIDSEAD